MGYTPVSGRLHTRYSPVRRSPSRYCYLMMPLDLHVLSLSLAFILSQDQTLRCLSCSFIFLCHSDSQTNNLGSSRHLRSFFSLDGGLPPSSFVLSLYRIISMFSFVLQSVCFPIASAKIEQILLPTKFFGQKIML